MNAGRSGARLRATAAEVVDSVVHKGRSLDDALAAGEPGLEPTDRPLLRLLAYGVLRRHWRLQFCIDSLLERPLARRDRMVNALLAVGLYQLSDTRIPDHAAVAATVEAARLLQRPRLAGLVNAVLRRALRDRIFDVQPSNLDAKYDHPAWLLEMLQRDWPQDWQDIVAANNGRAPMWLRVNTRFVTVAGYQERLQAAGIDSMPLPQAPQALRLAEPLAVAELPGFAEGLVSVQDAAAQLAAPWLLAGSEGRVLDACAAPGGKSAHLLELGAGKIALNCVDSDRGRLLDVGLNLDRLQCGATLVHGDASKPEEWWDGESFNAILLDAPCSATGVIRRHPDIKHLRRPGDIAALAAAQLAMLRALWPLLAAGGRLMYVTCSVLAAENEEVVAAFLEGRDDVRLEQVLQDYNIHDLMRDKACGCQVLPGTAELDGFYYACLTKVS
jgi:16S rRNA (cytosine967-C5)-methyltransferase